jgi:hypothetical protein
MIIWLLARVAALVEVITVSVLFWVMQQVDAAGLPTTI